LIFATGSIIGATLAPDISLATVPLSMYVVGLAAGTLPTGAISRAYGRRVAFIIGTGCGTLTGLLGAFAILHGSFVLFCCATFLGGLYARCRNPIVLPPPMAPARSFVPRPYPG
jgi:MFS family permease